MDRKLPSRGRGVVLFGAAAMFAAVLVGCDTTFAYVYPDRGHGFHGHRGHHGHGHGGYKSRYEYRSPYHHGRHRGGHGRGPDCRY